MESFDAEHYERLHHRLPGGRFVFMNHGYAHLEGENEISWLTGDERAYVFNVQLLDEVVRDGGIEGSNVLEVGCGRGGNCAFLASHYAAARVVGLDYSISALRLCRRVHTDRRIDFVHGSAMAMPVRDSSVDCLVSIEASHGFGNVPVFYDEVRRALKPGGRFCYTDCVPMTILQKVKDALRGRGFSVEREVDITDNVALAVSLGREIYLRTLLDAACGESGEEEAEGLVEAINGPILEGYRSGRVRYVIWQLRKPP